MPFLGFSTRHQITDLYLFPLIFLTILIPSYSLYNSCHINYFLEDYQWSLPAKLLALAFPEEYSISYNIFCYKPPTHKILSSSSIIGELFKVFSHRFDSTSLLFSSRFLSVECSLNSSLWFSCCGMTGLIRTHCSGYVIYCLANKESALLNHSMYFPHVLACTSIL